MKSPLIKIEHGNVTLPRHPRLDAWLTRNEGRIVEVALWAAACAVLAVIMARVLLGGAE